jgi:hypothetical protein
MIAAVVASFAIVPVPLFSVIKPTFYVCYRLLHVGYAAVTLFLTLLAMTIFLAAAPSMNMRILALVLLNHRRNDYPRPRYQ